MIINVFLILLPVFESSAYYKHQELLRDYSRIERIIEKYVAEERIRHREDVQTVVNKLSELQNTITESFGNRQESENKLDVEQTKSVLTRIKHAFSAEKKLNSRLRRDVHNRIQELSENLDKRFASIEQRLTSLDDGQEKLLDTCTLKQNISCLANLIDKTKADFTSCLELKYAGFAKSGVYKIKLKDRYVNVYCDQITDGGGWIVFQRRKDGSEDFYRTWVEYKHGFGDLENEFWLGNDNLADVTESCCHELRIDLGGVDGDTSYAKYKAFKVLKESSLYELNIENYSGKAGDALKIHNNMKFTTKDSDNDLAKDNCATSYQGAWWFAKCYDSHLNGQYHPDGIGETGKPKISWTKWKYDRDDGTRHSLTFSEMKLK